MLAGPVSREAIRREQGTLRVGAAAVPLVSSLVPNLDGPATSAERMLVRYSGPVLSDGKPTYQDYSFYDLYYSEEQILAGQKPTVDPAVFRDKIVVIGTTAAGLHDLFTVPFAEGSMPGMQVHASIIDSLLSQRFLRPVGAATNLMVLAGCALPSVLRAPRSRCGRRWASRGLRRWRWAGRRCCCSAAASGWRWPRRCLPWRSPPSAAPPTSTSSRAAKSGRSSARSPASSRRRL